MSESSSPVPPPPPSEAGLCGIKKELTAQQKVTAEWDAMAGDWDDLASGYAKAFYRMLLAKTDQILASLSSSSSSSSSLVVVDFGCGTGLLTEKLQSKASKILAIDASPKMIEMLQEKILCRAWTNVTAHAVVLANLLLDDSDTNTNTNNNNNNDTGKNSEEYSSSSSFSSTKDELDSLQGSVDLIVASSVLSFIPLEDLEITMRILAKLLKPGTGLLVHSDWPKSEAKHPDAMSEEKALQIYAMADDDNDGGLQVVSMGIEPFVMGDSHGSVNVFVGVARKPAA